MPPDGYYDVCLQNANIFEPIKLKPCLNPATETVTVSGIKDYFDFGFTGSTLEFVHLKPSIVDESVNAKKLPKLRFYKGFFIYLD